MYIYMRVLITNTYSQYKLSSTLEKKEKLRGSRVGVRWVGTTDREFEDSVWNTLTVKRGEFCHARFQNRKGRGRVTADQYSHPSESEKVAVDNAISLIGWDYKVGEDVRITRNSQPNNGKRRYKKK